uniref:G_PROTEIN_RECEP_F1_2 domain-containing protein n=1 Tax=Brugia timori TaxID=42155 RepID=A0A0R3R3M0_9BILA
LCHCAESKCNEQWIVDTVQRELNTDQMLYLLIGLAFIIISWNVLLCHINWKCKKITLSSFSLLLSCNTLTSTQKCSLAFNTLKIIVLACLLLASWIPATITCNNRGIVGRHIISKESSHIRVIKIFIIYYDSTFATVYYLSAYFMSKTVNSFEKLYHLECTIKMKHWMVAVIFAYLIGFLYMITAFLVIIIRLIEASSKKKENNLIDEDKAESPGQVSTVSLSTAHSIPLHSNYGTIEYSPQFQPFVISNGCSGILSLKNTYFNQWIAIRILTNNNELTIHPNKFLLPPERTSAAEVTITNDIANEEIPNRLLVQWYVIGAYCPARNVNTLWTRPHYVPRDQWHYKIIRVYSDFIKS